MPQVINRKAQREKIHTIDRIIQQRRTHKILGDVNHPPQLPDDFNNRVQGAVRVAGAAPFHFSAHPHHRKGALNSIVPWRFHILDQDSCHQLAHCLMQPKMQPKMQSEVQPNRHQKHKALSPEATIIKLLAGTGAMVLSTWLPEIDLIEPSSTLKKKTLEHKNQEYLMAASAATQNLLLTAEVRDIKTYWSSGGILGSSYCLETCGISTQEKLMGAIFMSPEDIGEQECKAGHLNELRGKPESCMHWVDSNNFMPNPAQEAISFNNKNERAGILLAS
jgi:nitroreductase